LQLLKEIGQEVVDDQDKDEGDDVTSEVRENTGMELGHFIMLPKYSRDVREKILFAN
jgi:hypothetical protein